MTGLPPLAARHHVSLSLTLRLVPTSSITNFSFRIYTCLHKC